ncbi:MAG TPA: hypothetical protein VIM70_11455 [Clostridium sp.]|uniref:hypothetical protein n=1 Tax=Clostridium sp. TaxID=1506 RepID=UPI002F95EF81
MQLGEIYKLKESCKKTYLEEIILISNFAAKHYMLHGQVQYNMIIIADSFMDEDMLYCSSLHTTYFENEEEILEDYDLFMTQEEYNIHLRRKRG